MNTFSFKVSVNSSDLTHLVLHQLVDSTHLTFSPLTRAAMGQVVPLSLRLVPSQVSHAARTHAAVIANTTRSDGISYTAI